jgi:hypothetical protein
MSAVLQFSMRPAAARKRNGFVPASRRQVSEKLRPLVIGNCPFVNLPEEGHSRWGEGLTAEDVKHAFGSS